MKTCSKCGEEKALSEFYARRAQCRACVIAKNHANAQANPEAQRERQRRYRAANREKVNARELSRRQRIRDAVFAAYGEACSCCGEDTREFLAIDHIDGKAAHGHQRSMTGHKLYEWLSRQGFPEGFQALCHNCNFAKFRYGVCPHQVVLTADVEG